MAAMAWLGAVCLRTGGLFRSYFSPWRHFFTYWERKGLHVLPVHYYSPVPDTRSLPESLWPGPTEMAGVSLNVKEALALVTRLGDAYRSEFEAFATHRPDKPHRFHLDNLAFSSGDAEMLYGMVRDRKPRRMVEVGAGYTTLLTAQAIEKNRSKDPDYKCEFVTIDPYPPDDVLGAGGFSRLIREPVQRVAMETFTSLEAGDILFLDSSHVVRIGSDVTHEFLEILPRLNAGVIVHVHDIFLPAEYPREWIHESRYFWNEQYLLRAFLAFNDRFKVLWPGHHMHRTTPDALRSAFPLYDPERARPSSFWMARCD